MASIASARRLLLAAITTLFLLCLLARPATGSPLAIQYPSGWNLVSGPTGSTLTGVSGSLYTLQPADNDYEAIDPSSPLKGCQGYWAYFPAGGSITLAPGSSGCSVALPPGKWVMLGNPSALLVASVAGATTVLTYAPGGDYQNSATIPAGQGAWAMSAAGAQVTLSALAPPVVITPSPAPTANPAPSPTLAPTPVPAPNASSAPPLQSGALTQAGVAAVVHSVAPPAGVAFPSDVLSIIEPGGIIPLFTTVHLDVGPSDAWEALGDSTKLSYVKAVITALHTAFPSLSSIYFVVWNRWEVDFIPESIPIQYVDVCSSYSHHLFCPDFPDYTARWYQGSYAYQRYYSDENAWRSF